MQKDKQDLRFKKAEQKITETFFTLIKLKGFDKLTVTDITREAKINRSTFYAHYVDKYDLLNKVEVTALEHIYKILEKINSTDKYDDYPFDSIFEGFKEIANYLNSEREVINILYNQGDGKFFEHLKDLVKDGIHKLRKKNDIKFNDFLPSDYADELIVSSALDIILFWIQKEEPEGAEEFAKVLANYRQLIPFQLLKR